MESEKIITDADLKPYPERNIDFSRSDIVFVKEFPAPKGDPRDVVMDYMKKMASIKWTPREEFATVWRSAGDFAVNIPYSFGKTYYGVTYGATASSLELFELYMKDGRFYSPSNFYEEMVGNNCSTSIAMAYQQVVDFPITGGYKPTSKRVGLLAFPTKLNKPPFEKFGDNWITQDLYDLNSENDIYEAFAKLGKGDLIYKNKVGSGHTRMVSSVEITRKEDGTIDRDNSYMNCVEQTNSWDKERPDNVSTWFVEHRYRFDRLYVNKFMPVTLCVFHEKEPKLRDAHIVFNAKNNPSTLKDTLNGTVESDFVLNYVRLTLTSKDGTLAKDVLVHMKNGGYTYDVSNKRGELFENVAPGEYTFTLRAGIGRGGCDIESFGIEVR